MKKLVIEITAEGEIKIDAQGFKGADCAKVTEAMEKALGAVGDRKKKPEYTQAAGTTQTLKA